ncbi:OmpA family protein [Kaarinaea lacus]
MKNAKIRFIETFTVIAFPIALAVGCTTTGEPPQSLASAETSIRAEEHAADETQNVGALRFFGTMDQDSRDQDSRNQELNEVDTDLVSIVETNPTPSPSLQEEPQQIRNLTDSTSVANADVAAQVEADVEPVSLSFVESEKLKTPEIEIIHFGLNAYQVKSSAYEALKQHALFLQEHPQMILNVNGYADNRGPAKLNYDLSKKRAEQIADILITFGAPQHQLHVNSYGESFPLNDENNWDENRRVELRYIEENHSNELMLSEF